MIEFWCSTHEQGKMYNITFKLAFLIGHSKPKVTDVDFTFQTFHLLFGNIETGMNSHIFSYLQCSLHLHDCRELSTSPL